MRRISTATRVVDKFGVGKDGFTNGDAVSGIASTDLEDVWFDSMQEEIANVIEGSGISLDPSNRNQLLAAIKASQAGIGKNRIINGRFKSLGRSYTSGTPLAVNSFSFDRWFSSTANSSMTYTVAPQGQPVTVTGSFKQVIERINMPAGSYTLSWAGNGTARIYNSGSTPPAYGPSPIKATVDGTANVIVEINSGTFDLVQVEPGTVQSSYNQRHFTLELLLAQRYYAQIASFVSGWCSASNVVGFAVQFPTQMARIPNLSLVSCGTISDGVSGATGLTGFSVSSSNTTGARVGGTSALTTTPGRAALAESLVYIADGEITS